MMDRVRKPSIYVNNMVVIAHPLYLLDLAHCDFALFPKLKMKQKGRRFEIVSDVRRELQVILDSKNIMGSLYTFPARLF
jgi:hypothetical protein